MLFPTHLLAAALLHRVSGLSPWWLVVGAAVPDVVDKPLAMIGVTELFHSIGHSAVLVVVAVPLALAGRAGTGITIGWASHLTLDALHVVINGRPWDALFLTWPFAMPPDPLAIPPGSFFLYYLGTPSFVLELLVWLLLAVALYRRWVSGRPLLGTSS